LSLSTTLNTSPLSLSCTINSKSAPHYKPPHCHSAALSTVTLHPTTHLPAVDKLLYQLSLSTTLHTSLLSLSCTTNCQSAPHYTPPPRHSAALSTVSLHPTTNLPTVTQLHYQLSVCTPLQTSPLSLGCIINSQSAPHYKPPHCHSAALTTVSLHPTTNLPTVTKLHYQLSVCTPLQTSKLSLSCIINSQSAPHYTQPHCHSAALTTVSLHPNTHLPTVTQLHIQQSVSTPLYTFPLSLSFTINCHSPPHYTLRHCH